MTRRTVVVSTFSPAKDGIAKYADQLVRKLQENGPVVEFGLPGSGNKTVSRLDGGLRPLGLLRKTARSDRLWLMWHPQYYVSGRVWVEWALKTTSRPSVLL